MCSKIKRRKRLIVICIKGEINEMGKEVAILYDEIKENKSNGINRNQMETNRINRNQ